MLVRRLGSDFERRSHESRRVFGLGVAEDLLDRALLDDLAVLHDHDAVAERAHDLEVVRDEEVGEARLVLQLAQQLDDLGLHRQVERRGRLVEEDELGLERDGAGDGEALPLPAGEFVREAVEDGVGHAGIA